MPTRLPRADRFTSKDRVDRKMAVSDEPNIGVGPALAIEMEEEDAEGNPTQMHVVHLTLAEAKRWYAQVGDWIAHHEGR